METPKRRVRKATVRSGGKEKNDGEEADGQRNETGKGMAEMNGREGAAEQEDD